MSQYYIDSFTISDDNELLNNVANGNTGLHVQIVLWRRLLNEILTTFLPCIFICIVVFSTNYFKVRILNTHCISEGRICSEMVSIRNLQPADFEAIVTVNLTSLLVLVTLFISVSNSLPRTSYVKLIDVWLIFNLLVPFTDVLLHTIIDVIRNNYEPTIDTAFVARCSAKVLPEGANLVAEKDRKRQKLLNGFILVGRAGLPVIYVLFTILYFGVGFGIRHSM